MIKSTMKLLAEDQIAPVRDSEMTAVILLSAEFAYRQSEKGHNWEHIRAEIIRDILPAYLKNRKE